MAQDTRRFIYTTENTVASELQVWILPFSSYLCECFGCPGHYLVFYYQQAAFILYIVNLESSVIISTKYKQKRKFEPVDRIHKFYKTKWDGSLKFSLEENHKTKKHNINSKPPRHGKIQACPKSPAFAIWVTLAYCI